MSVQPAGPGTAPRTTVVVATRNRRDQLLITLSQLRDTSGDPPVVVVDNGSSDGTPAAVATNFPEVGVVLAGSNLGAAGRTLGVERATTPFVAFADDDSWWGPGALERAADLLDAAPRLAVLAARVLVGPKERLDPTCPLMARSPLPRRPDLPGPSVLGFLACGSVVRRTAYLGVGGFSPVLGFLGEEEMLAQDLSARGWGLAYVADVIAHHHPRPGAGRSGRRRLQVRNSLLSSWLRRPLPVALQHTGRVVKHCTDADARGGLLDAVRSLPAVARHRHVLPPWTEHDVRLLEAPS